MLAGVAQVELTAHLHALFSTLPSGQLCVDAETLAQVVSQLEKIAPGIAFYICDERGRLRRHVNIFVAGEMLVDRRTLGDHLDPNAHVFIAQALSGG